jgi:hypothetical protein
METVASVLPTWVTLKFAIECASAVLGMTGTWLLSRRYADPFWQSVLYAIKWAVLAPTPWGKNTRKTIQDLVNMNRDVPDSIIDMVLGLNLIFWAFLLQLAALVMGAKKGG